MTSTQLAYTAVVTSATVPGLETCRRGPFATAAEAAAWAAAAYPGRPATVVAAVPDADDTGPMPWHTGTILADGRRVYAHRTDELESILSTELVALGSGGTRRVSRARLDVVAYELALRSEPQP